MEHFNMNEEYSELVENKVVKALLQAYLDMLDYDGMCSILKEAGMQQLNDLKKINSEGKLELSSFKKIISAQDLLLYHSHQLLFLIGKRFSFYLFPYGKDFEDCVEELNRLIQTDWKIEILMKKENSITINIENCIFCSNLNQPCELIQGFLVNSLEKTLFTNKKIRMINSKEKSNSNHQKNTSLSLRICNTEEF